jgi:hypothetical protein
MSVLRTAVSKTGVRCIMSLPQVADFALLEHKIDMMVQEQVGREIIHCMQGLPCNSHHTALPSVLLP